MLTPGSFFAQVVGTTGAFLAPASAPAPTQNPLNTGAGGSCVAARTGAGVYTLTFANPLPTSEYKYSGGCIGGAANANFNFSVTANVCTILTSVAAVATDENFWIQIEPISC
jgi:hypothetical protein